MKISFIIPTYNTKVSFLKRCILSILEQDCSTLEYEIIVVNDGSTERDLLSYFDNLKFIDKVIVISKTNGGVSSARNVGVKAATGDYICFVDADDYLSNKFFSIIKKYIYENKDLIYFRNYVKYKIFIKKNKSNSNNVVWGKVIRKKTILLNEIYFDTNLKYCEDTIFMKKLLKNSSNFIFINEYLYVYCLNQFNATNSYAPTCYLDFNDSLNALKEGMSIDEFCFLCFFYFLNYVLSKAVYNKKCRMPNKDKKALAIKLINDKKLQYFNTFNINIKKLNKFRQIELKLIKNYNFKLALFINKIYRIIKFFLGRID